MTARLGTRCQVLQTNVLHASTQVQLVVSSGRHAAAAGGERGWGAVLVGLRVHMARMQAAPPRPPP